jgi:arabinosaccharide transport system substrate-binding protein
VKVGRVLTDPEQRRYVIALSDTDVASFEALFYQKGGDFFDAEGKCTMDSAIAVDLICWMIPLVRVQDGKAGTDEDRRIAHHQQWGQQFYQNVSNGLTLSFICPDWRCGNTEHNLGAVSGKMGLMKLPAWERGGRRTSTWGGTMLAFPRQPMLEASARRKQRDLAEEFALAIYFDKQKLIEQMKRTKILPPFKDAWAPEALDRPDPYWSNQPVLRKFAEVAEDIPPRNGSPFLEMAKTKLGEVLASASSYYKDHGAEGFREHVRAVLEEKADYIRRNMKRNPF